MQINQLKIIGSPLELMLQKAKELYPDLKANIFFTSNMPNNEKAAGCTLFPDNGDNPEIFISVDIPFSAVLETLAHELAHVVVGYEYREKHSKQWQMVFDKIYDKWSESFLKELDNYGEHIGVE